jgi:hypothetical protein
MWISDARVLRDGGGPSAREGNATAAGIRLPHVERARSRAGCETAEARPERNVRSELEAEMLVGCKARWSLSCILPRAMVDAVGGKYDRQRIEARLL